MSECNELTLKSARDMIKTYNLYKLFTERKKILFRSKPRYLIHLDIH